jgi:hypothetical protein
MRYLAVLLLAGCASHWDRPGGTADAFERDLYACQKDAAAAPTQRYERMVDACLRLKGWQEK